MGECTPIKVMFVFANDPVSPSAYPIVTHHAQGWIQDLERATKIFV